MKWVHGVEAGRLIKSQRDTEVLELYEFALHDSAARRWANMPVGQGSA